MNIWKRLFSKPTLVPYNYGAADCPALRVGDVLFTQLQDPAFDFIAGFCRMDGTIKPGKPHKWKVKEVRPDGDALCVRGSNRFLLKYLTWSDGNLVTIAANLCHSQMKIRFFTKSLPSPPSQAPTP